MAISIQRPEKRLPASTRGSYGRGPRTFGLWLRRVSLLSWILLCIVTPVALTLFAWQVFLVPQPHDYTVNWHGARWIQAPGATDLNPISYYRKSFSLETAPQDAFLYLQAQQYFWLYVNGQQVSSTTVDFRQGQVYNTYVYDVAPLLQPGLNTIAVRVVNRDVGTAALRAVLGIQYGNDTLLYPTDATWRVTDDASLTLPYLQASGSYWASPIFRSDLAWQFAAYSSSPPSQDGVVDFNPLTFELAQPSSWLTSGASPDSFFANQIRLPGAREVWLRVASTGIATVYMNGQIVVNQPPQINVDQDGSALPKLVNLTTGVYDITPYQHKGANVFAVHVASAGFNPATAAHAQPAAMLIDLIVVQDNGTILQTGADGWVASPTAHNGWTNGAGTGKWITATAIDSDTVSPVPPYKIPAINDVAAQTLIDRAAGMQLIATVIGALLLVYLLAIGLQRLLFPRRFSLTSAVDRLALSLAPVLAWVGLLKILSDLPVLPNPFPFSRRWFFATLALAAASYLIVLLFQSASVRNSVRSSTSAIGNRLAARAARVKFRLAARMSWLRALPPSSLVIGITASALTILGALMVFYDLAYESYWQDELASVTAAQGVLRTGFPEWATGFFYTKAELFSYILAGVIRLFGTDPSFLRAVAASEFLITMALLFFIGRYFVNRWAALAAMVIYLLSPVVFLWAREARMYQQVQMMVLVVVYLFWRAVQPGARTRYIYLSMGAVVLMYLSHEESFIVLPMLVLYFFISQKGRWLRNKHWWIAGLMAIACIGLQLFFWRMTRRPLLGTDHTVQPLVGFYPQNINFYLQLMFSYRSASISSTDNFQVVLILGFIGAALSIWTRDRAMRYLALMLCLPLVIIMLFIGEVYDRYIYMLLPIFVLLAVSLLAYVAKWVHGLARRRFTPSLATGLVTVAMTLCVISVGVSQISSPAYYNLAASRALGLPYRHFYPDYERAGNYIKAHWQPGDALLMSAPVVDGWYYVTTPDYNIYLNKALSLYETSDGEVLDNSLGTPQIFNLHDFNDMLSRHHRIWLFSNTLHNLTPLGGAGTAPLFQNFALVYEGQQTFVYLRSG